MELSLMKSEGQKVSIALATYNGAKYLEEQLHSFLQQTRLPDELVVTDDNSTDETVNVIKNFAKLAPFKVSWHINGERLGYSANFNKALALVSGSIVFLSDQDDVWKKNKIEQVLKAFDRDLNAQLLVHDLAFCNEHLEQVGQTKVERIKYFSDPYKRYITGMATAVRKDFLNILLPIPQCIGITHDLWLHECARLLNVKRLVPDVLALYRRHGGSVTSEDGINVSYKVGYKHFLQQQAKTNTQESLIKRIVKLGLLKDWLERNRGILVDQAIADDERISQCMVEIDTSIHHTNLRLSNLKLKGVKKAVGIFKHYAAGGYKEFSGNKSFLKDLLSSN
jgi:glycosyltransferase involved in cell wall biosynthesis